MAYTVEDLQGKVLKLSPNVDDGHEYILGQRNADGLYPFYVTHGGWDGLYDPKNNTAWPEAYPMNVVKNPEVL